MEFIQLEEEDAFIPTSLRKFILDQKRKALKSLSFPKEKSDDSLKKIVFTSRRK